MPTIKRRVTATTADALQNEKFSNIPPNGAILNAWAAGVTGTDDIALLIGDREIMAASDLNIEVSADVIDTDRDQVVFNEVIPGGKLYMPCTVTTELQVLISLKYL